MALLSCSARMSTVRARQCDFVGGRATGRLLRDLPKRRVLVAHRGGALRATGALEADKLLDDILDGALKAAETAFDSADRALSSLGDRKGSFAAGAKKSAAAAFDGSLTALEKGVGQAALVAKDKLADVLPPELLDLLDLASKDSSVALVLAGIVVGVPLLALLSIFNEIVGGYAGPISAEQANENLQNNDAILIDTRSDDERAQNGIPELRRGARNKGAAVEILEVLQNQGATRSKLNNAKAVDFKVAAVKIAGVSSPGQEVYIMGSKDSSKPLARAVAELRGRRKAYTVKGGFQGWEAAELSVRATSNYQLALGSYIAESAVDAQEDLTTAAVTSTTAAVENVTTKATSVGRGIQDLQEEPLSAGAVGSGVVLALVALVEWEQFLQIVGLWGIVGTTFLWTSSYESLEDLSKDLKSKAKASVEKLPNVSLPDK